MYIVFMAFKRYFKNCFARLLSHKTRFLLKKLTLPTWLRNACRSIKNYKIFLLYDKVSI